MRKITTITSLICAYGIGAGTVPIFFGIGAIIILAFLTACSELLKKEEEGE